MSEQEVTYATVRFHKSSGLQNQVRLDETQGPREASHKVFQYSKEKHELQETLNNLNHNYSSMKNESYLNKGMLRNKSIECNSYKNLLDTFKRQQNRCHMEAKVILDCLQHRGMERNLKKTVALFYIVSSSRSFEIKYQLRMLLMCELMVWGFFNLSRVLEPWKSLSGLGESYS
ncbi:killer cell lectin-like receptor 2 isoform X2 [Grammomys surdaster]|uniref:killer cell lectin-like receptor 2 isoform X2 n=1 Tax=Grammomys surdaster TaxID=491861 RepID=UPI0010A0AD66|nr:killer cell lectin-like receptor 2 isoform X2 [Grammomys surdaster]